MIKKASLLLHSLIAFTVFTGFISPVEAKAQVKTASPSPNLTQIELQLVKDQYEFLKTEAQHYEDRVDRERHIFYAILAVALIIPGIIGVSSYITLWKKTANLAEEKLEEVIAGKSKDLKREAERWAKSVVDGAFGFEKKILLIAPKKYHQSMKKLVTALARRGFKNIEIKTPRVSTNDADLIVFFFNDETKNALEKLVQELMGQDSKLPVIAYCTERKTSEIFKKYDWGTFANSPLTLASWAFTILSASSVEENK